jgi:hypothetical protein
MKSVTRIRKNESVTFVNRRLTVSLPTVIERIKDSLAREKILNGTTMLRPVSANGVRYAEPKTNKSLYQPLPVLPFRTVIERSKESLAREKIFNGTTILRPVSARLEPSSVRLCGAPFRDISIPLA